MGRIDAYMGLAQLPTSIPPEMPIYSRGLPSSIAALNNGTYHDNAAINLNRGAIDISTITDAVKSKTYIWWTCFTKPTYTDGGGRGGIPRDFTIQVNTAPGGTGVTPTTGWSTISGLSFTGNTTSMGLYPDVDLSGVNWWCINPTADNGNGVALQVDLHDGRNGTADSLAIWGNSVPTQIFLGGALAGGTLVEGPLETQIEAATGRSAPVIVNVGFGGATTGSLIDGSGGTAATLDKVAALPVKYVMIGGGVNDCANAGHVLNSTELNAIIANYQTMITTLQAVGKIVILPTVTWGDANASHTVNVANLNALIPALLAANPDVIEGPDYYALTMAQNSLIFDHRHFSYDGASQPVTTSAVASFGIPTGWTGAEAAIRLMRDVMVNNVYTA